MKYQVTPQQITNELYNIFSDDSRAAQYLTGSHPQYLGVLGWCGPMSPMNRAAFLSAFGAEQVAKAEQEARGGDIREITKILAAKLGTSEEKAEELIRTELAIEEKVLFDAKYVRECSAKRRSGWHFLWHQNTQGYPAPRRYSLRYFFGRNTQG